MIRGVPCKDAAKVHSHGLRGAGAGTTAVAFARAVSAVEEDRRFQHLATK